jgi:hypothetical protein
MSCYHMPNPCNHNLEHCKICDKVYCKICKKEWEPYNEYIHTCHTINHHMHMPNKEFPTIEKVKEVIITC